MFTNLLWTGTEYHSLENCLVKSVANGFEIDSIIIGFYQDTIFRVAYKIKTTMSWETNYLEIHSRFNNERHHSLFESDANGNWKFNGNADKKFSGCIDVDLSLTPFTNTLPVNRLNMDIQNEQVIEVLYCDVLQNEFRKVNQRYIRLSDAIYRFQNVPNDFESEIEVDGNGFIVNYPQLFKRTAIYSV